MKLLQIFFLLPISSCALLISSGDLPYLDDEYQHRVIDSLNNTSFALQRDSLFNKLNSATSYHPENFTRTKTIIEIYNYSDWLSTRRNRFYTPLDDESNKKWYSRYNNRFIEDTRKKLANEEIVYLNKNQYTELSRDDYRYIIKTTNKLEEGNAILIQENGSISGWASTRIYYICDRKTNELFKPFSDFHVLKEQIANRVDGREP